MIVTVSRQFGSGGRELGKRLADALGLQYFDRELVTEIATKTALDEGFVSSVLEEGGFNNFAFSYARTMPLLSSTSASMTDVLVAQQKIITSIGEKGDCVIVGRCADLILRDLKPVRLFVYADEKSKIERCRARAEKSENLTDKEFLKNFKKIDKGRAKLHDLLSSSTDWGEKEGYDLMVNTSGLDISTIIAPLAEMVSELAARK
ncbi:MAG: cytidylate kinase-like family protein [Clostridia bacterium]|nr:cytidylate kinase-like family protein [Clostridia bacterium]